MNELSRASLARNLLRAGAEADMVEDFRALLEATAPDGSPRYRTRPTLETLARFLVGNGGGPNRDAPFYELCHLVNAVDAAGGARDRRHAFFLAPEAASPQRFRARLDHALTLGGWRRDGFTRDTNGVTIDYGDGAFSVHFARMPFLAALYEFFMGMDDFTFYPELQAAFDEMGRGAHSVRTVQAASNRIASHFRHYRRRHMAHIRHDGKFDMLLKFLMQRSPEGTVSVDDAAVFDFWAGHATSGDFRAYRTVFDAFVHFMRAMEEAERAQSLANAAPVGTNRDDGEVEPNNDNDIVTSDDWVSPFTLLDQEPAAAIKFFKKEGERKPLEFLMHYGPAAIRLPLAFLRLEAFAPVQSGITTDLQVGRGLARVKDRVMCTDATPYVEMIATYESLLKIISRLQKAAFYALHKNKDGTDDDLDANDLSASDMDMLLIEAAKTFRAIARKGFDENELAANAEGFRLAAAALPAMGAQIVRYLAVAERLARAERLETRFAKDRQAFSERFCMLYGVTP